MGTTVTLSATASTASGGNCAPQFEFWTLAPGGGWTVAQSYSSSANYTWSTNGLAAGSYDLADWARATGSGNPYETYAILTAYPLNAGCTSATLSTSMRSPQPSGSIIGLTSTASGCTSPQYEFWVDPPNGNWQTLDSYVGAASDSWNTGGDASGQWLVAVWVREAGNTDNYDTYAGPTPFTITPPLPTTSQYVTQKSNLSAFYTNGYDQAATGEVGMVVLDFGQPLCFTSCGSPCSFTSCGTQLFMNGTTATIDDIQSIAEQFLMGYYDAPASSRQVILVLGTNNYKGSSGDITSSHGQIWGQLVNSVNNWINTMGYQNREQVVGGIDLELQWDSYAETSQWLAGYESVTSYDYIDYGNCICPYNSPPNSPPAACPVAGYTYPLDWSESLVYTVAQGDPQAAPLPEIYQINNAYQWQCLSRWAYDQGNSVGYYHALAPVGSFTQCAAQTQVSPFVCTETPGQGWSDLDGALGSDSRTIYTPPISTDIRYGN